MPARRPRRRAVVLLAGAVLSPSSGVAAAPTAEPCYSGKHGDSATAGCMTFCKAETAASHCAMCKCLACSFCDKANTSSSRGGAAAPAPLKVKCEPPKQEHHGQPLVPFVMWMSERTGSSWETDLLNSHPDIVMGGESSTCRKPDAAEQAECLQGLCKYFTTPVGQPPCPAKAWHGCPQAGGPRVRGFKQKLFLCNDDPVAEAEAFVRDSRRSPPLLANPLETCLGYSPQVNRSWVAESLALFQSVGARVICSLRRNAFELAMSSYTLRHVLYPKCNSPNIGSSSSGEACWQAVKREGVHVDEAAFLALYRPMRDVIEYQRSICERLARTSPVFFLWYEDLVTDFARTSLELQAFLGVKPVQLSTDLAKVNSDSYSYVTNVKELLAATNH